MKKFLLPLLTLSILLILQVTVVSAASSNSNKAAREATREKIKVKIESRIEETKAKLASRSALKQEKLETVKLKVCEKKQDAIVRRSTRLAERAQRQLTSFEQKENRVEDYYNNRLLPKGVTVANYSDLIADIESKKQVVNEATTSAKTTAEKFDCNSEDPKGQLTNYRIDMQNAIKALKEYRTSIKNLIVAVRTAAAKLATGSATATNSSSN